MTPEDKILIGLVDADLLNGGTRHPNLLLLKLAGFLNDNEIPFRLILDNEEETSQYTLIYISKVFSFTPDPPFYERVKGTPDEKKFRVGGTGGYAIKKDLQDFKKSRIQDMQQLESDPFLNQYPNKRGGVKRFGIHMPRAVEGDMLRDTRLHAPFAQGEVVPGGVFQPREDPFVGPAARPHVAHGLLGDVEVLQPAGLLLAEDHARAAVELLHLAPRQLVDVAPAHARQTREDEGVLQHRIGAVGLDQPLQLLDREVFAVDVFGSRGLDPHGGRLGNDPLLDGPVQCRLELQEVAVLAVGREGGAALRAGLLGEVVAEPLDKQPIDPFEGGLRPRIGDQVFQHAVPVAPVTGRILALLDHPADKLDQVGADLERHGEPVLLVLLGK